MAIYVPVIIIILLFTALTLVFMCFPFFTQSDTSNFRKSDILNSYNPNKSNISTISFDELYSKSWSKIKEIIPRCKASILDCPTLEDIIPNPPRTDIDKTDEIYKEPFKAIIEPTKEENINFLVVIPVSPCQVMMRAIARHTYMKTKNVGDYKFKYIFIIGRPNTPAYTMDLLQQESDKFRDLLVLDYYNDYRNLTIMMLSTFKYTLDNYPNIKYLIRCNGDAIFFPDKFTDYYQTDYLFIAQRGFDPQRKLPFPDAAFFFLSKKFMSVMLEQSKIVRPLIWRDDFWFSRVLERINATGYKWDGETHFEVYSNSSVLSGNKEYYAYHPINEGQIASIYLNRNKLDKFDD